MKTIGHCKDCKHYVPATTKAGAGCVSGKICDDSTHWGTQEERDGDMAFFSDYEGYQADFEPGPLFGCIHWEAKP